MSSTVVALSDEELLGAWTELEQRRRRLAAEEHAVVAEVEQRGLARARGMCSTAVLASRLLRISPAEARARVAAAGDLGPRRGLTGEELPPVYPLVAAAQADGAISAAHAKVIVDTVEALPGAVRVEYEDQVEADLVGFAARFDPTVLAQTARRITAFLDPDGTLQDVEYRHRRRYLDLHRRADGSAHLEGDLDVEAAEYLQVVLDALSAPKPAQDGSQDPRTAGQRRHDALLDLCQLGMRARLLPTTAGVTTTVVLLASPETLESESGLVATGTGAVVPGAGGETVGLQRRPLLHRAHRQSQDTGQLLDRHPAVHRNPTTGTHRERPWLQLPRLHRPTRPVPNPPHHRLGERRTDGGRKRHPAVRIPPPRLRRARLDLPTDRRRPAVDRTRLARPPPNPTTQPSPPPPRPCIAERRPRASAQALCPGPRPGPGLRPEPEPGLRPDRREAGAVT